MLYQGTRFDAATWLVVAAALGLVVLIATIVPARRALQVDPANVLRQE